MSPFFFENPLFLPFLSHGVISPTLTCFTLAGTPFEGWLFYLFLSVRLIRLAILSIFCIVGEFSCFLDTLTAFFFPSAQLAVLLLFSSAQLTKCRFSI
jgi:hypothetical protein